MFLSYKYAYVQNGVKSCYINKVTGEWLENHVQQFESRHSLHLRHNLRFEFTIEVIVVKFD